MFQPSTNNLEESQSNPSMYRDIGRGRSLVGPMRSRPAEKRHDTSPYSGVPYLSPPPPDTWRRTNSDSALHQSVNDSCQMPSTMPHRRGSDACRFLYIYSFLLFFFNFFNIQLFINLIIRYFTISNLSISLSFFYSFIIYYLCLCLRKLFLLLSISHRRSTFISFFCFFFFLLF